MCQGSWNQPNWESRSKFKNLAAVDSLTEDADAGVQWVLMDQCTDRTDVQTYRFVTHFIHWKVVLCHWSALPSCGHTSMSKYTVTTLCVCICLCDREREADRQTDRQTDREMELWAPVALYLSPNSHMKCRQGGKKVSSLGLNGDPHPRFNHTPPKHLITSDSIITHEIGAIWFLYITSKGLVFYFKCASTPLRAGGMWALPPSFRNASFYSSSGSLLLIEAALISRPTGGFFFKRNCKSMYKMLSVL